MVSRTHMALLMQLGESLSRTGRRVWSRYDDNYTCLTPALDKVISIIGSSDNPITVKQIARFLLVSPGAATQHITALEEQDAVTRVVSVKDRREVMVHLTPRGRELLSQIRAKRLLLYEDIFGTLSDDELQTLIGLLTKASASTNAEEQ
jgi:DNA-binding MarR family transcriptional regulator